MKVKSLLLIMLSLSAVFVVACSTQLTNPEAIVQEEVIETPELSDNDFTLIVEEEIIPETDFIEIGEMI